MRGSLGDRKEPSGIPEPLPKKLRGLLFPLPHRLTLRAVSPLLSCRTELEREGCEELPTGKPGHQAHATALQAVRKFWSKTRQNRILSWLIFSSCAPAALRSHRSVVVCIIWERKPSPFRLRPQAPKPVAGQILPAGFPFPGPLWARTPWKVLG